jgi:hypothetical protein
VGRGRLAETSSRGAVGSEKPRAERKFIKVVLISLNIVRWTQLTLGPAFLRAPKRASSSLLGPPSLGIWKLSLLLSLLLLLLLRRRGGGSPGSDIALREQRMGR